VNKALQKLQEDMLKMQQEQANKIVTPDELRGGNDLVI
jgi:DNA-binding protein YbaB